MSGGVSAEQLRELLDQIHRGPAQEAAAARIAIAIWRRAIARQDAAGAAAAIGQVEAHLEALFDGLAAAEARGKALLAEVESPPA